MRRGLVALSALLLVLVTQTAVAHSVTPTCGGVAIAKSTGGYWQCTFDDEFSGHSLNSSVWSIQQTATSGFGNQECYLSNTRNVSVSGGTLNLTVRHVAPFTCHSPYGDYTTSYSSGMVTTGGKFAQAYGRFEVRARLPAVTVKGLQESFWLWPANSSKYGGTWPSSGEIDIAEIYHVYPDRAIPYVHYDAAAADPGVTNNYCLISDISAFHSYDVEWTPSSITVIYDGTTCLVDHWAAAAPLSGTTQSSTAPFDQPFFISLTQALGVYSNAFDPATTPLPATTQIDWVRVWK